MNLSQAPEQGIMYALYIDRVVFEPYKKEELPEIEELRKNLLELHLFDASTEYRVVVSKRGEIEAVIRDDGQSNQDIYTEKVMVSDKQISCVEVVNYLSYDENDLMMIKNYRLKEVEECVAL